MQTTQYECTRTYVGKKDRVKEWLPCSEKFLKRSSWHRQFAANLLISAEKIYMLIQGHKRQ